MLDTGGIWRIEGSDAPPAERLVAGRRPEEAREMIGRVFNLCRAAQVAAFDIATGRAPDTDVLADEMRRDHLAQIFLAWPRALGRNPVFDKTWLTDGKSALRALFGPPGRAPRDDFETQGFLGSDEGVAPMLAMLSAMFAPGQALAPELPIADAANVFGRAPVKNSPAGRRAATPALDYVAAFHGRGPLWRAMGRVMDLAALLEGERPAPLPTPAGSAVVPATRGLYALKVTLRDGVVSGLARVTPTDHLLAPGGAMAAMLATLPPERAPLLPVLTALVDPCRPFSVEAARDA
jgi:hypothetical protein